MYRSSPNQLANLRRREQKAETKRTEYISARLTPEAKQILSQKNPEKVTLGDVLEAIAAKLQQNNMSLADFLKSLD